MCGDQLDLFSFTDQVVTEVETRELSAVRTQTPGEVTLDFVDAGSLAFLVDEASPPLLPEPGPVRFFPWSADCWGEGCDPTFHALENDALGRFLELGILNMLDGHPFSFGPRGSPLSLRYGTDADTCTVGDGEVPAVLQVAGDQGSVDVTPGLAADVLVGDVLWHARSGFSERREMLFTEEDCEDCPTPGLHSETKMSALLYRRAP